MKRSKTFLKWQERIEDVKNPWTEHDIIYFRKTVGSSGLADPHGRYDLRIMFEFQSNLYSGFDITPSQTAKGIGYLKNAIWKKNGQRRQTAQSKVFSDFHCSVIKDFSHFKFIGVINGSSNGCDRFLPVYLVVDHHGNWFQYTTDMGRMQIITECPKATRKHFRVVS